MKVLSKLPSITSTGIKLPSVRPVPKSFAKRTAPAELFVGNSTTSCCVV